MSCLASPSGTSWWRREEGGTQRRLGGGSCPRPEALRAGPVCRALSVLPPVCALAATRAASAEPLRWERARTSIPPRAIVTHAIAPPTAL